MEDYLALTDLMLHGLRDLFQEIDEDPLEYSKEVREYLPTWMTPAPTTPLIHHTKPSMVAPV